MDGSKSRMECTDERISELKSRTVETWHNMNKREKIDYMNMNRNTCSLGSSCSLYYLCTLCINTILVLLHFGYTPSYNSLCLAGYTAVNRCNKYLWIKKMNRASETCGTIVKDLIDMFPPRRRRRKRVGWKVLKEIKDENFPNLTKYISLQIQEAAQIQNLIPKLINFGINLIPKLKTKKKILKAAFREKQTNKH